MMATSYLPSVVQSHAFGASSLIDPLKSDKFLAEEHENEISKWLKLENEPSYDISSNCSFAAPSVSYATTTATSQLPTLQPEFSNNYTSPAAYTFNVHSSVSPKVPPQSPVQSAPQTISLPLQTQYASPPFRLVTVQHTLSLYLKALHTLSSMEGSKVLPTALRNKANFASKDTLPTLPPHIRRIRHLSSTRVTRVRSPSTSK